MHLKEHNLYSTYKRGWQVLLLRLKMQAILKEILGFKEYFLHVKYQLDLTPLIFNINILPHLDPAPMNQELGTVPHFQLPGWLGRGRSLHWERGMAPSSGGQSQGPVADFSISLPSGGLEAEKGHGSRLQGPQPSPGAGFPLPLPLDISQPKV